MTYDYHPELNPDGYDCIESDAAIEAVESNIYFDKRPNGLGAPDPQSESPKSLDKINIAGELVDEYLSTLENKRPLELRDGGIEELYIQAFLEWLIERSKNV